MCIAHTTIADGIHSALDLFPTLFNQSSTNHCLVVGTANVILQHLNCTFVYQLKKVLD